MKWRVACIALAMLATNAEADTTTGKAAFGQAEALVAQNKWAEACPLYEASFRADPQLGALLALAECHERIGRVASSWSELNDALELAQKRNDPRVKDIQAAITELAPKVPKLKLTAPARLIPNLTVKRDNVDITLLVGSEIPADAGEHELVAEAPDYEPWRQKVTVKEGATVTVEIPALAKAVAKPLPQEATEGTLTIKTLGSAQIIVDSKAVGTGRYEGKVKAGGHTLRVVAGGMRPYQTEVVVGANEARVIDVVLENDIARVVIAPRHEGPSFELGASLGSGVKVRNDQPLIITLRAEAALRLGRRVNFGTWGEYGEIDTSNACGFDMAGPMPNTPFDFGPRNQFKKCWYLMSGLQLYVHVRPEKTWDPYLGIAPGFRFGFADYTPYVGGTPQTDESNFFPAIVVGVRAGVNYHPKPEMKGWEVGAFFESSITVIGDETSDDNSGGGVSFVSLFGGLRTSLQF